MKLFLTSLLLFISLSSILGQTIPECDTIVLYDASSMTSQFNVCIINGDTVSQNLWNKIIKYDDAYWNSDTPELKCVEFRSITDEVLAHWYDTYIESGHFYTYKEYYPGGALKVIGNYIKPDSTLFNGGVRNGKWTFFRMDGSIEIEKNYINGYADGKWSARPNSNTLITYRFANGYAHGEWRIVEVSNGTWTRSFRFDQGQYYGRIPIPDTFKNALSENLLGHAYNIVRNNVLEEIIMNKEGTRIQQGKFFQINDGLIKQYKEFDNSKLVKRIAFDPIW